MTATETTPKIYVGTYAKYNSGSLFGEWVELDQFSSLEEFYDHIKELHKDESDPEFMFQDYEGIPEDFISENWISEKFWDYLNAMNDLSEDEKEAFEIFVNNESFDLEKEDISEIVENFREAYCGRHKGGLEDYAYDLVHEVYFTKDTPGILTRYFDYQSFARDLGFDGYWEEEGYVFRNY